jgi:magnesium-transporting ATPase (P-type)
MLHIWQSFIIVVLIVAASLLFTRVLNRLWPPQQRSAHNDLIGWQLSVLGTTYAVILGFMLYTVWTDFGVATLNADNEANALGNVYRLAAGLPDPQRQQLKTLARAYADAVINQDWPEMDADRLPEATHNVNQQMWDTLMSIKNSSPTEIIAEDHALYELSALTEHRRLRLVQFAFRLPAVLWCVLIFGAVLTVVSAAMFGSANQSLHTLQVVSFSLLVALVLVAIGDIDRPFQGSVHVSDFAFRRAQQNMKDQAQLR